ncbi:MAG: histidine kinase [Oscillospiraceae bacterium]|nr:histidine kinase [Oscillospiraceae bacterium]
MENKQSEGLTKTYPLLFLVVVVMTILLLSLVFFRENVTVTGSRVEEGYLTLEVASPREESREGTPLGLVEIYELDLDAHPERGACLVFYTFNQYADVYVGEELVYSLGPVEQKFHIQAVGGIWVNIPLQEADGEQSVRVEITPVYDFVRGSQVDFLLGDHQAIFVDQLQRALPELAVSLLLILLGLIVLLAALAWRNSIFYLRDIMPLGLIGIMMAVWRITDSSFAYFLDGDSSLFLYYTSLISLGFVTLFLTVFLADHYRKLIKSMPWVGRVFNVVILSVLLMMIYQLAAQLTGYRELRYTLPMTHTMMILDIVLLVFMVALDLWSWHRSDKQSKPNLLVLLLGLGLGLDLMIYYVRRSSSSLIFTMVALLILISCRGAQFFRRYLSQEKTILEKEYQLTKSQNTLMLSQIRSHFVFNILNAISGMCKYDPELADETVICFARYLRTNINIMQDDRSVPFRVALGHVEDYFALEQVRFGHEIQFEEDLEVEDFMIPPLLMQPLVENAIRHGLLPRHEGGTVILRTRLDGDYVRVDVQDNGVGFDPEAPGKTESVGMQNVRFRLENIARGHMVIRSAPGQGTTVSLYLPREECML